MYSNNPSRRASKGSVQIKVSNERIQLVFSVAGKRHYLSTGLADTPSNRKLAERKAALIEDDIFKERLIRRWKNISHNPRSAPLPQVLPQLRRQKLRRSSYGNSTPSFSLLISKQRRSFETTARSKSDYASCQSLI